MANTTTPEDDYDFYNKVDRIVRIFDGGICITATILGLIGNIIVIISFAASDKLQTKTNIFVVNLAFADIVTSMLLPTFAWSVIADIDYPVPDWIDTICAIAYGTIQVTVISSILNLAFIAVNRLILITKSRETYDQVYRVRYVTLSIVFTWLYPVTIVVTPLYFGIGELGFDLESHICAVNSNHEYSQTYSLFLVNSGLPVPVIILYSYARIFNFVNTHNKRLKKYQQQNPHGDTSRVP